MNNKLFLPIMSTVFLGLHFVAFRSLPVKQPRKLDKDKSATQSFLKLTYTNVAFNAQSFDILPRILREWFISSRGAAR